MTIHTKCLHCGLNSKFNKIYEGSDVEDFDYDEERTSDRLEYEFEIFICTRCNGLFRRDGNILFNGEIAKEGSSHSWYNKRIPFSKEEIYLSEIIKCNHVEFSARAISAIRCAECGFFAESMMALRSALEVLVVDGKPERMKRDCTFAKKIKDFGNDRSLNKTYNDNAEALLDAGHGAIHRDWKPKREDVSEALKLLGCVCREINIYNESKKFNSEADTARTKLSNTVPPPT